MPVTTLRLYRRATDGPGEFKVLLDGNRVATLGSGDAIFVEVQPGRHRLQFKFAYISSPPVDVYLAEGESKGFAAERAFGFGPFDLRYFTRRREAISVAPHPSDE